MVGNRMAPRRGIPADQRISALAASGKECHLAVFQGLTLRSFSLQHSAQPPCVLPIAALRSAALPIDAAVRETLIEVRLALD